MEWLFRIIKKKRVRPVVGQSLVELLVAMGLTAILLPALLTGLVTSREGRPQAESRSRAVALMREGVEALRVVRESGWTAVSINGTYHAEPTGNTWTLIEGEEETADGYTRAIVISGVYRDETGAIVTSGGNLDPSTKKVNLTVDWNLPYPGSLASAYYITRYLDNLAYVQTSEAEFESGSLSNSLVVNTAGGEVQLAANTKAKWCEPQLSSATVDLPGVPRAVFATEGNIYVATGQSANPNIDAFAHVLVANTDPPQFTINGTIRNYQTSAVFGEPDWGYIATTNNSREIVIINLNEYVDEPNKIFKEEGYFNTPFSNTNGDTVYVLGDRGYLTSGRYLYVFDLSSRSGARPQVGNRITFANSGDNAGAISVREVGGRTYVFLAIEGSTVDELKIAEVTNPNVSSQWQIVGQINIEPNNCSTLESGKAVYVKPDGSRAYISSVNDTTFKEFFSIDTSNKSAPSLIGGFATNPPCTNGGGYEAGGMNPEQSVVVSAAENRAVLVGVDDPNDPGDSEEYQVLDVSDEGSPTHCGGFHYNTGLYGVAGVTESDGDTFAYLITGDDVNELKVVQGGPDGAYLESGSYESAIFDVGYSTAFNRIEGTTNLPANTNIRYQVAVADPVSGSCNGAEYVYVGPDGTGGSYFPAEGEKIALDDDDMGYENPGRCFRYKAFLNTSDYNQTPTLFDVTVNYSP